MSGTKRAELEHMAGPHARLMSRSLQKRLVVLVLTALTAGALATAAVGGVAVSRLARRTNADRERIVALAEAQLAQALRHDLEQLQALAARLSSSPDPTASRITLRDTYVAARYFDAVFVTDPEGRVVAQEPQDVRLETLAPDPGAGAHAFTTRDACDAAGRCRTYVLLNPASWRGSARGSVGGVLDPASHRVAPLLASVQHALGESFAIADHAGRPLPMAKHAREGPATPATALPWRAVAADAESRAFPADGLPRLALPLVAIVGALLLAFAWGGARSVAQPLETLTRASERMAAGDMDVALPQPGGDEVGRLGAAFDRMRLSLRAARTEIEEANRELERRVEARTRELQQLYGELQARDRVRARLLRQVISAQEDERKRIARELHDDTCQMLAAIAMRLAAPPGTAADGDRDEVRRLVIRTVEGVRRQIHDLRPSALDDLGLVEAIRAHAERHLRAGGVQLRFETNVADVHLPREREIATFRAVQELVTNVERHAKASHVVIEIAQVDGHLTVDIEDDGCGFDWASMRTSASGGVGLIGVGERVELAGGEFTIDSAPGRGTHAHLEVPLEDDHGEDPGPDRR